MRELILSLLLILNSAWALPAKGGNAGGGGAQPLGEVVWPIGG